MRRALPAALTDIHLDANDATPLYRQLYDALRRAILAGRLVAGQRLPSTRAIADEFDISRNTVLNAIDQLLAEGYIEGRQGAGTYVAAILPDAYLGEPSAPLDAADAAGAERGLSARSTRFMQAKRLPLPDGLRSWRAGDAFDINGAALDRFPGDIWQRLLARRWRQSSTNLLAPQRLGGHWPLREAIAQHLAVTRGVRCEPAQVLIVSGCHQAIDLAAQVLLDPGDDAWIEDPGYLGARNALVTAGANVIPIPIDSDGMIVNAGLLRAPHARLAFVAPSCTFPVCTTLSLSRRLALLDWATRTGAWILEDDYDSEYRYAGRPLASLQSLDTSGAVIYIGTFERILFPALRLGYMVVPPHLLDAFAMAFQITETQLPLLEQAVLADFIAEGYFARHVRQMRALYEERQHALVDAVHATGLDAYLEVHPADAGMHLVGWLPPGVDDRLAAYRAGVHGIRAHALSHFALDPLPRGGLLLGYAASDIPTLRHGAERLCMVLHDLCETVRGETT